MKEISLISLMLILSLSVKAQSNKETSWTLRKELEGIQVFERYSDSSDIPELKVITHVKSTLGGLVYLANNIPHYPSWVFQCKEGILISKQSELEFIYINRSEFPWPLTDRDVVFACSTFQEKKSLIVYSTSVAKPEVIPENSDYIRVKEATSNWSFKPLKDGTVQVEYFIHVDPEGRIPTFIINWAADLGPIKSMKNFRSLAESEQYNSMRLPFIVEP